MADKFFKSLTFSSGNRYFPLPIVSSADNGKVLKVVDGEWSLGEYPKILMRIEVTTSPTTVEYTEGDSLDLTGLIVTATFSDGTTEDVTSQCIMSPADGTVLATTDTSVNISYTYKGVTRSTAQIIVVEAAATPYLSFLGNEDFTLKTDITKNWDGTLEYSTDTITWNTWNGTEISSAGSKLYLRGTGNTRITGDSAAYTFVFAGTDTLKIACKGNIENLLDYETVSAGEHPTMTEYCYFYMFYGCTSLTSAPALPATTLTYGCYQNMFNGCRSITTAPELPATTLAGYCYRGMFNRCTALTTAPRVLPATTLVDSCYRFMFEFTAIDAIPRIMATTYAENSCIGMFDDIKSLNVYSTSGTGHTYGWTAPSSASTYCSGMFGSDDGESEWAKLDGSNFPNSGTPTDGTTYYFKTVA